MAFSKRAEELRIGKTATPQEISCLALRGAPVTESQCSSRNRSYQQNTHLCVDCPRRFCPHCISEGRSNLGLAGSEGACPDHLDVVLETATRPSVSRTGKFTPSEESLREEQNRPVTKSGCGHLHDYSLIDYHSLIER